MLPFKSAFHLKEERVAVRERRSCSRLTLNTGSVPLPSATEGRSDPCWLQRALATRLSPPPKPVKPASATVVDLDCGSTLSPPVTLSVLCLTQKHLSKQALIYDSSERCNLRFSGTRRGGGETKNKKKTKKWASQGCQTSCDHFFAFPADMKEATGR